MSDHIKLIWKKLDHLVRMRGYLSYSLEQTLLLVPIQSWVNLSPENHETLAAFRVRFSEFQEHLGKAMRAIAIEEEQKSEPYTAMLLYMEKLQIIESAQNWKEIRELRNAVNHEYEENAVKLSEFFMELTQATPQLFTWHDNLVDFCQNNYSIIDDE
jgi:hypothetical protein